MAKFNNKSTSVVKTSKQKTVNKAGGEAYKYSNAKLELATFVLTSFVQDQFYRSGNESLADLKKYVQAIDDKKFMAKLAIYARTVFGMRSITHALASELAKEVKGVNWTVPFFSKVVSRPDDMTEIISYYLSKYGKPIPNSMKRGIAKAFEKFDAYQLSKYRAEGKGTSLVDVVNIVHPHPSDKNKSALKRLIKGELKSKDTWESKLTEAGRVGESEEEVAVLKSAAWDSLIKENKLGYMALLKNLRNIGQQTDKETLKEALKMLVDENKIKKSLVLPFRYLTAYDEISKVGFNDSKTGRDILTALSKATDIAVGNIPVFDGSTLVVLDTSGSMTAKVKNVNRSCIELGALFATALWKSNNADLMVFSNDAKYVRYNPVDNVLSITDRIVKTADMGGTDFHSIFRTANKAYNRIIILSDMQGWMGGYVPTSTFTNYCRRFKCNPYIYSFDLAGYGSLQLPENKVFCIAGFSEQIFKVMKVLEQDKEALVREIERIEL